MTNCRSFARRCQRNYLPTVGDLQHFCVFCQWKHPLAQSSRRRWIWSMTSLQQRKVTEVPVAKATIGPRLALWTLRRGWPCQAQCLNFYKLWDYKIIIWFVFVHIVYIYIIYYHYFLFLQIWIRDVCFFERDQDRHQDLFASTGFETYGSTWKSW